MTDIGDRAKRKELRRRLLEAVLDTNEKATAECLAAISPALDGLDIAEEMAEALERYRYKHPAFSLLRRWKAWKGAE